MGQVQTGDHRLPVHVKYIGTEVWLGVTGIYPTAPMKNVEIKHIDNATECRSICAQEKNRYFLFRNFSAEYFGS